MLSERAGCSDSLSWACQSEDPRTFAVCELLLAEDGRNSLARTTPGSKAVNKDSLVCCGNEVLKLLGSVGLS